MPSLTGSQIRDLQNAMLDTFAPDELDEFVRVDLQENLAAITGRGTLRHTIFELIQWCERRGRLEDLLSGVLNYGPTNNTFLSLAKEFGIKPPAVGDTENRSATRPDAKAQAGRTEINSGGGAIITGDVHIHSGDFVGRDKVVNAGAGQAQPVWWDQLTERIEEMAATAKSGGGDVINVNIGDNAKNVAVGKDIQQTITEVIGTPTPDDQAVIQESFTALVERLDVAQRQQATFQLKMLETELTKTGEDEQPSGSAITLAGDWMIDNLPDIGEALTSFFALPAVGRVLGKAGKDTIKWAKERFGDRSE